MNKIFNNMSSVSRLSILLWIMGAVFLNSCGKDDEEPKYDVTIYNSIEVCVVDKDGHDLVEEWFNSSDENKSNFAEFKFISKNPQLLSERVYCDKDMELGKMVFVHEQILACLDYEDKIFWRFKIFETDTEEILIEGVCKKIKPYDAWGYKIDMRIQWSCQGVDFPMDSQTRVTLVRTEDGTYTIKQ